MIGALGACFGRVVAMDSPRGTPGEFQWEATLWHELTHVITLQMSNQRLPRWLSEGISTYEEKKARADWARQQDYRVRRAARPRRGDQADRSQRGVHESAADLDRVLTRRRWSSSTRGDLRRRRPAQADSIISQGIENEAAIEGDAEHRLRADAGRVRQDARQVVRRHPRRREPPEDVEAAQDGRRRTARARRRQSAQLSGPIVLGTRLRKAGKPDEAMQEFETAAELLPIATGPESPHAQMADIALEKKDVARAIAELQALVAVDFDNVEAPRQLVTLLRQGEVEDAAKLRPIYERIAAIDPFDAEAHAVLGRLAMQRNDRGERVAASSAP